MQTFIKMFGIVICILCTTSCRSEDTITLFPLEHYNQTITDWITSNDINYDKPLMNNILQQNYYSNFYEHYFGRYSPWDKTFVTKIIHSLPPDDLKTLEVRLIDNFSNRNKSKKEIGYGENFHPYPLTWIEHISNNIDLHSLENIEYKAANLGIAIDNLDTRALPTNEVHFYHHKMAGQGYPFDVSVLPFTSF